MTETAWLIELVHDLKLPSPRYATVKRCTWTWTDDAFEAVRFSRKQDAELAARFVRLRVGECMAVEHGFAPLIERTPHA